MCSRAEEKRKHIYLGWELFFVCIYMWEIAQTRHSVKVGSVWSNESLQCTSIDFMSQSS